MAKKVGSFIKSAPKDLLILLGLILGILMFLIIQSNQVSFSTQSISGAESSVPSNAWGTFGDSIQMSSKTKRSEFISSTDFLPESVLRGIDLMSFLVDEINESSFITQMPESVSITNIEQSLFDKLFVQKVVVKKAQNIKDLEYLGYEVSSKGSADYYHLYFSTNEFTDSSGVSGFELVIVSYENSDTIKPLILQMTSTFQLGALLE